MTSFALDSSVMLSWILQEAGRWQVVDALLSAPEAQPILPGPALTECIVAARRSGNTTSPARIAATLSAMGVRVEAPVEADLIRAAQLLELSAQHPGRHARTGERLTLSLGDALILAVTERLAVKVVTRDRHWSQFAEQGHTSAAVVGF